MQESDHKTTNNSLSQSVRSPQAGGAEPNTVLLSPTTPTALARKNESTFKKFTVVTAALIIELIIPILCALCTLCAMAVSLLDKIME